MSTTRVWNDAIADEVIRKEDAVDHYEDVLGTYLVKLSAKHLSVEDNRSVNTLLHTIGDFERVSDHAVNIIKTAQEIRDKGIKFSEEALNDLSVLEAAVQDIVNRTVDASWTAWCARSRPATSRVCRPVSARSSTALCWTIF